jgi:hypothetical protein
MATCSHEDGLQSFGEICCLLLQGQAYDPADGSFVFLLNVGIHFQGYTLVQTPNTTDNTYTAIKT